LEDEKEAVKMTVYEYKTYFCATKTFQVFPHDRTAYTQICADCYEKHK